MKHVLKVLALLPILNFGGASASGLNVPDAINACAPAETATKVQAYFAENPGASLSMPARKLGIPEVHVVTSLPKDQRLSIDADADTIKNIWTDIDTWGKDAHVQLIFTNGGKHVFHFPSNIPMRQADLDDGWLDIYADDGAGVHGHMWLDQVASVHAADIPGKDGQRTRQISFYAPGGHLALRLYASLPGKEADAKAVNGFSKTWKLLETMPQLCP